MNWLDNWILKRAKRIRNRNETISSIDKLSTGLSNSNDDRPSIGSSRHRMNFTVYRANGGVLVEVNRYDERKDQHYCELHIVTPDEDLGASLGKIVTFEGLKSL
jgi:hypothetical protein